MHWRLRLAEDDFQVMSRKGVQNIQGDNFSHLTTNENEHPAENDDIACLVAERLDDPGWTFEEWLEDWDEDGDL